jgi:hypothetical protein
MSVRTLFTYIAVSGVIAADAGAYLVVEIGWVTLVFMAAGVGFVLFYTWPLKYNRLAYHSPHFSQLKPVPSDSKDYQ